MLSHKRPLVHNSPSKSPIIIHERKTLEYTRRSNIFNKLKHLFHSDKLHQFFSPIASAENKIDLQIEINQNELLGNTQDGMQIILCSNLKPENSSLLREIGRLREYTFRKVGEGTGKKRDLDSFDEHYQHLILWDTKQSCLVGSYRLGNASAILKRHGVEGLYTHSLYRYKKTFLPFLSNGLELGRSFVNPDYWGKNSLDYLWQGIGAYINQHPELRYLFGPVSMSANYPVNLMAELSFVFQKYYSTTEEFILARTPYQIDNKLKLSFEIRYSHLSLNQAMKELQKSFGLHDLKIPVLFKQYVSLFEPNGFHILGFSVDINFGDCLDGFCMADLTLLKANKRKRYIAKTCSLSVPRCSAAHDPRQNSFSSHFDQEANPGKQTFSNTSI